MDSATDYLPQPIDTSAVALPAGIEELTEKLAENAQDLWAMTRLRQGWNYGPRRDDEARKHPCLVPYRELPDAEKEYDRQTAMETLKVILALGYRISK